MGSGGRTLFLFGRGKGKRKFFFEPSGAVLFLDFSVERLVATGRFNRL